jgi:RNA polymerase sigma-70 factor, ECF subfamily
VSITRSAGTEQLVQRARNPAVPLREQHEAFARLVEQSQHLAFGWALSSLRNAEEARDAAQDAFTAAWVCLHQIHDASAFTAWLKRIVATQCHRRLRRRGHESLPVEAAERVAADTSRGGCESLVASAIAGLAPGERHVIVLFYFLGHTQAEIARMLGLKPGTVGKRLHSARLKIRRSLPSCVRKEFLPLRRTRTFLDEVRAGLFDEYVGEYRFERRPDHVVSISRQGDSLQSSAGGQTHLLLSLDQDSLLTSHYDGEGRFRRNRQGRITHFVYYEFGKRLGIARRTRIAR